MVKAIIRAARIAIGQLIMTSLDKRFMAPQILSVSKPEKTWLSNVFYKPLNMFNH